TARVGILFYARRSGRLRVSGVSPSSSRTYICPSLRDARVGPLRSIARTRVGTFPRKKPGPFPFGRTFGRALRRTSRRAGGRADGSARGGEGRRAREAGPPRPQPPGAAAVPPPSAPCGRRGRDDAGRAGGMDG